MFWDPPSLQVYNVELRSGFLRLTLVAALCLSAAALAVGGLGLFRSLLFPWDGLGGICLCVLCGGLYWRGGVKSISFAASWLVAGVNILAGFYSQFYGIKHAVTALFLVGIVLAGMLIGGWFLRVWTMLGGGFVLMWGILELNGLNDIAAEPVANVEELIVTVGLWWLLFGLTGWLIWQFARHLERAAQISQAQATALTRTLSALGQQARLETFLQQVLGTLCESLQTEYATLFLHTAEEKIAVQAAFAKGKLLAATEVTEETPAPLPAAEVPIWQDLLARREPLVVAEVERDERLKNRALLLAQGIQSILYVPLLQGEQVQGFISINRQEKRPFTQPEIELAQALAQQVVLALQLSALAAEQEKGAITAERNRMAREIHDTLAQGFTGILIQLEAAEDVLDGQAPEAHAHLLRARSLARSSLTEARRSVWALRPQALDAQDLPGALELMVQRLTAGSALRGEVRISGQVRPLPSEMAAELLRVAQEGVHNALKHSGGSSVTVDLDYGATQLILEIGDDGQGFESAAASGGFGLTSMRERVEMLNGRLDIQDSAEGVTLRCDIPLLDRPAISAAYSSRGNGEIA